MQQLTTCSVNLVLLQHCDPICALDYETVDPSLFFGFNIMHRIPLRSRTEVADMNRLLFGGSAGLEARSYPDSLFSTSGSIPVRLHCTRDVVRDNLLTPNILKQLGTTTPNPKTPYLLPFATGSGSGWYPTASQIITHHGRP
jgi:hypothetical protein